MYKKIDDWANKNLSGGSTVARKYLKDNQQLKNIAKEQTVMGYKEAMGIYRLKPSTEGEKFLQNYLNFLDSHEKTKNIRSPELLKSTSIWNRAFGNYYNPKKLKENLLLEIAHKDETALFGLTRTVAKNFGWKHKDAVANIDKKLSTQQGYDYAKYRDAISYYAALGNDKVTMENLSNFNLDRDVKKLDELLDKMSKTKNEDKKQGYKKLFNSLTKDNANNLETKYREKIEEQQKEEYLSAVESAKELNLTEPQLSEIGLSKDLNLTGFENFDITGFKNIEPVKFGEAISGWKSKDAVDQEANNSQRNALIQLYNAKIRIAEYEVKIKQYNLEKAKSKNDESETKNAQDQLDLVQQDLASLQNQLDAITD